MSKPTNVNKVNEALVEIVNLASAAILSEDERVKRQALGDIAETVGWICGKTRRKIEKRYINCPESKAISFGFDDRKICAFLTDDHQGTGYWGSYIYLDGKLVADVCVYERGKEFCSKATDGCMRGIVRRLNHSRRNKANRKAKNA